MDLEHPTDTPTPTAKGMGGHHATVAKKDEWLTPPEILKALGPFDLDPCAPIRRPWPMAANHFTIEDRGHMKEWAGRVWCNPPYGAELATWLGRCADHGNAIALVFARTETEAFQQVVFPRATALFFFAGRLTFYHVDGTKAKDNGGAPSVLIAFDEYNREAIRYAAHKGSIEGTLIPIR